MFRNRITISAFASLAVAVPSALADDLTPPAWRGDPGTTFQHWGFNSPGGGPPDSGVNNPYGNPQMIVGPGVMWDPIDPSGQRMGSLVLSFNDTVVFEIPNHGHQAGPKELWLQYTYTSPNGLAPQAAVFEPSMGGSFTLVSSTPTHLGGGLFHRLDVYSYPSCPSSEFVTLSSGLAGATVWIDQVVIDTRCIPAPGALGLLAAAGALAIRRRRR